MQRKRVVESFESAASTIGPIEKDMSLFCITRGQFSMIDAIYHCIDSIGPANVSIWTWTVAVRPCRDYGGLHGPACDLPPT